MQDLCEIDLIDSVHDRKMKLIQEEKRKDNERREKERQRHEKRRKEEALKRKAAAEEALAQLKQENINHRKRLEEIAMSKEINISLSDVDILRINEENDKELIDVKKIEFKKINEKEMIDEAHHILMNNKVDGSYNDGRDIDLHLEQVMDHDEDYENEDPEDEEDIENEITDEEILEKEKELIDELDDNQISSGSSLTKSNYHPNCVSMLKNGLYFKVLSILTSSPFNVNISVIFILTFLMSYTHNLQSHYISYRFNL